VLIKKFSEAINKLLITATSLTAFSHARFCYCSAGSEQWNEIHRVGGSNSPLGNTKSKLL